MPLEHAAVIGLVLVGTRLACVLTRDVMAIRRRLELAELDLTELGDRAAKLSRRVNGLADHLSAVETVARVQADRPGRTPDAVRHLVVRGHFDQKSN